MIKAKFELYATNNSVDRTLILGVVADVKKYFIGNNTRVPIIIGSVDKLYRSINDKGQIQGKSQSYNEAIIVEVTEDSDDDGELLRYPVNPYTYPFYIDNEVNARCQAITHIRKTNLSIKYMNKSGSYLESLKNRLRALTANDDMYMIHKLEYSYVLPNMFTDLIITINDLKNNILPTKLTLEEYINKTFDNRVDVLNTQNGNILNRSLVIRERLVNVYGYITGDVYNIPIEKDDELNMYTITLEYSFTYDKPIQLLAQYEELIFNQPLPSRFTKFNNHSGLIDKYSNKTLNIQNYDSLHDNILTTHESNLRNTLANNKLNIQDYINISTNKGLSYITIPYGDSGILNNNLINGIKRLFTVLIIVDPNNPNNLFKLSDLPFDLCYKDCLIKTPGDYISRLGENLIYLELYRNNMKQPDGSILIDNLGNLTTKKPMDIKSIYRVAFNLIIDTSLFSKEGRNRIYNCLTNDNDVINKNFIKCLLNLYGYDMELLNKLLNNEIDIDDFFKLVIGKKPGTSYLYTVEVFDILVNTLIFK